MVILHQVCSFCDLFLILFLSLAPLSPLLGLRVADNKNDAITSEEHSADGTLLHGGCGLLLSLASLTVLNPGLAHVLKDHIEVSIERLDASEEMLVVSARHEHWLARLGRLVEDRHGSLPDFGVGVLHLAVDRVERRVYTEKFGG